MMQATVLTIDNNNEIRRRVARRFRGAAVSTSSTEEGIRIADQIKPLVVLLDSRRMESISQIRAVAPRADIIVCTDEFNELESRRARKMEVNSYVRKKRTTAILYEIFSILSGR